MKTLILFMAFGSGGDPDFAAFEDPKPQQTELRSVGGVIYECPVGSPWSETTKFKPYLLSGTQPDCPVGQP